MPAITIPGGYSSKRIKKSVLEVLNEEQQNDLSDFGEKQHSAGQEQSDCDEDSSSDDSSENEEHLNPSEEAHEDDIVMLTPPPTGGKKRKRWSSESESMLYARHCTFLHPVADSYYQMSLLLSSRTLPMSYPSCHPQT
jgi:hypothetical protein